MEMKGISTPSELFAIFSIDEKGISFCVYTTHLDDGVVFVPMSNVVLIANLNRSMS